MSIYYVIRLHRQDERHAHYMGYMPCMDPACPIHPTPKQEEPTSDRVTRFLWREEAEQGLRDYLAGDAKHHNVLSGQVFLIQVKEIAAGASRTPEGAILHRPDVVPNKPVTISETCILDEGESLLKASNEGDQLAFGQLHDWLQKHVKTLLEMSRQFQRLDWLRQHPESCRAYSDCRNPRAPGVMFCAACCTKGVGGYLDVYQVHYYQQFNDLLNKLSADVAASQGRR